MARTRLVIDLATGERSVVPYTAEEEAAADAAYEAEQVARSAATAEANGIALDQRQKETAKGEAAALWKAGKEEAAFNKLLEMI